jgi:hypothetical protein
VSYRTGAATCWLISCSHSIDSLLKLHQRAAAVDSYFDARIEPDTSRSTWNEIRDNVERGATQHDPEEDLRAHIRSRNPSPAGLPEYADDRRH